MRINFINVLQSYPLHDYGLLSVALNFVIGTTAKSK